MDNFDRRVRDSLLAMPPDWEARAAGMRKGVQAMYEERIKKAAAWTWIGSGIGVLLLLSGIPAIILGVLLSNAAITVVGAMMFLFGDGWIGFSKLLYWVWNSRIRLERDIKEVHADVLDALNRLERLEAATAGKREPGLE
jgi:hypothetical protein